MDLQDERDVLMGVPGGRGPEQFVKATGCGWGEPVGPPAEDP